MYAPFFWGYWLSDDFGFLHQMWLATTSGELWTEAWRQFFGVDPAGVVFYRPMMIASVALNEWITGNDFAGWFGLNYLAHLANAAMVALLVVRFARACDRDGRIAGVVAATFFALCPALAEGVFWIAARADACVTLLTLVGVYSWASRPTSTMHAAALPLLLFLALGFKESATVFPLQMTLVALAWPKRLSRAQILAVAACFVLAVLYFAVRAHFFGDFWRVYTRADTMPQIEEILLSVGSIGAWWTGLTRNTPIGATAYIGLSACALLLVAAGARGACARIAAALLCAFAGVIVATLLSVGEMAVSGEGGRLSYTPMAWFALAIGVASSQPMQDADTDHVKPNYPRAGLALLLCATIAGAWVLQGELRTVRSAQDMVRGIVRSLGGWAVMHPGLTLLLIEENYGPVVATRNAQAWIALPPVQPTPQLDHVLPTLSKELIPRYDQLAAGLATRLREIRPSRLDADELSRLFKRDAAHWPEHYACWSVRAQRIVEIAEPDPGDPTRWTEALRSALAQCAAGALPEGQLSPRDALG